VKKSLILKLPDSTSGMQQHIPKTGSCISLFLATTAGDNYVRSKHERSQVHYPVNFNHAV
jgi:hypothetical protein